MQLRAVLFDLDGTLLNRRETFRCHIELQAARLAELFTPAGAIDIDRMMAIDDNGNCPRADFYRKIEIEFGLAPGASSRLLADLQLNSRRRVFLLRTCTRHLKDSEAPNYGLGSSPTGGVRYREGRSMGWVFVASWTLL